MLSRRILLAGAVFAPAVAALAPAAAQQARTGQRPPRPAPARAPRAPAAPPPASSPADTPIGPLDTVARWAVVLDFNTGATLLDKNADEQMPPSSMTKLMTIYIVYSLLKSGRLKLDQTLPVSEKAWRMGGSKMFVGIGTQVRVEDLIRGIIVDSGNDACIVFAEAIAGSEDQFAELMNQKAKELGLTNSHFVDSTGWPADGHVMSVRDIATLAGRLIHDFPEYYHYDSERTFKYNNIEQQNRNPLVQKGTADGLKTGHTEAGGFGVVASAQRGNRRVIVVVNGLQTNRQRSEESERLMDWAFREFDDVTLFSAGEAVDQAPVWLGTHPTVPLVSGRDVVVTMPHGWRNKAKISVSFTSPVPAPVVHGAQLGTFSVSGDGVPDLEVPLLAGTDVPRLGLVGRAFAVLTHMVTGG